MDLQSVIVANAIGVLVLGVLLVSSRLVRMRRELGDMLFTLTCVLTVFSCAADSLGFGLEGIQGKAMHVILYFFDTVTYLNNIIVSALWCLYVDVRLNGSKKHMLKTLKQISLPGAAGIAGLVINLFYPFIFTVNDSNVYSRLPFANYYFALTFFYLFTGYIIYRNSKKDVAKMTFIPIRMFICPIIICTAAQFLFYGVSLAWCSVAVGLVCMHISLQNELTYLDPLTQLYNRNYLNNIMKQFSSTHSSVQGIMMDMDDFKMINDTFGHSTGDKALTEAARLIKEAAPDGSVPIRFAGDEFMLLIPGDDSEKARKVAEVIRSNEKAFNKSGAKPYKLSFSLGLSSFSGNTEPDSFLKEMDRRMYEEKRIKHCNR